MVTDCMPHFLEFYTGPCCALLGPIFLESRKQAKKDRKWFMVTVKMGIQAACDIAPEDLTFSVLLLQRLRNKTCCFLTTL